MATPSTTTTTKNKAAGKDEKPKGAAAASDELAKANAEARQAEMAKVDATALAEFDAMGDEFVELQSDYYTFKPETCKDALLRGYLVGKRTLESDAFGEFEGFFILTTQPTKAHKGKEDKPSTVPSNRMVMIVANAVLKNRLQPLLEDPTVIFEVGIVSAGTIPTKGGFDANDYKTKVLKKPLAYETIKPMLLSASAGFQSDNAEFPPANA